MFPNWQARMAINFHLARAKQEYAGGVVLASSNNLPSGRLTTIATKLLV